jgi:hypothetical protein
MRQCGAAVQTLVEVDMRKILTLTALVAISIPMLVAVGCTSSGSGGTPPYGLTGQGGATQTQGQINRAADERRSPMFRKGVNVLPNYPA